MMLNVTHYGEIAVLTDEHPSSDDGYPVLLVDGEPVGPGDLRGVCYLHAHGEYTSSEWDWLDDLVVASHIFNQKEDRESRPYDPDHINTTYYFGRTLKRACQLRRIEAVTGPIALNAHISKGG